MLLQTVPPNPLYFQLAIAILVFDLALLIFYLHALDWTAIELLRFFGGALLLWAPVASVLYLALRGAISSRIVRGSFSALASYALTTVIYFACAVLHVEFLFYGVLASCACFAAFQVHAWWPQRHSFRLQPDWILITIVLASLVSLIPLNTPMEFVGKNGFKPRLYFTDHYYHAGMANALRTHVPPLQTPIRAGTPERAYHMFPHLTTMLIARFSLQPFTLRAHIVYQYAVISTLICLGLYSTGFLITNSRGGGYLLACVPFLFAIATPSLGPDHIGYFYFTWFPQFSSTTFPTAFTSPQMFSGVAVFYGVLLGVTLICYKRTAALPIFVTAAMVGAMARFRVHVFLAVLPAFLFLALWMWWRERRWVWPMSIMLTLCVSACMYLEMQSPEYLKGTAHVQFGFNHLNVPFFYDWPGSSALQQGLTRMLTGEVLSAVLQCVSVVIFVGLNIVGLPLLAAIASSLYQKRMPLSLVLFLFALAAVSMVCSVTLTMNYDAYSVPAQMLFHIGWYLLPFFALPLIWLARWAKEHIQIPAPAWAALAAIVVSGTLYSQRAFIDDWHRRDYNPPLDLTANSWAAYQYLRTNTAHDSVILDNRNYNPFHFFVSGVSQRTAFVEAPGNPIDEQAMRLHPEDNRRQKILQIYTTKEPAAFCRLLLDSPITHVLEYAFQPLPVQNAPCLQKIWSVPEEIIWQVRR